MPPLRPSLRPLLVLLAVIAPAAPAAGHDFWIEPDVAEPKVAHPVRLRLLVGHGAERQDYPRTERHLVRFWSRGPGGEVEVRGVAGVSPAGLDELLAQIQHRLFDIGAELAASGLGDTKVNTIDTADVAALESAIDRWDAALAPLTAFILPGGSAAAAQLHHARCVCRRAERRLVELASSATWALDRTDGGPVRVDTLRYVNRLGDLLFVLVNVARRHGIESEAALRAANDKFRRRFRSVERQAAEQGVALRDLDFDALDELWHVAKAEELREPAT